MIGGLPSDSDGKESTCNAGNVDSIPGLGRPMEKERATHSSILAWRIPWTEQPGGLQSMGSPRVKATAHTHDGPIQCVSISSQFL